MSRYPWTDVEYTEGELNTIVLDADGVREKVQEFERGIKLKKHAIEKLYGDIQMLEDFIADADLRIEELSQGGE